MFVVVPYLSSDQSTYGIYSVCISVTIFLSYADLGFLGAGMKYAAESFSRGEKEKEIELIGFSHFILLIFVLLLSGVFLYLSFNPSLLIKDISSGTQQEIAHKLLLILAFFTPVVVVQRMLQVIFGIRLQEYNLQKINIIGSVIKIASVFYFFSGGRYDIVGYYLFLQLVSVAVVVCGLLMAHQVYNYDFGLLLRKFKFSKKIFNHTKSLAFSSLFVTLAWVLYYELDSMAIGKMLGTQAVAIYAIGLTLLGFLRSLFGVFFSPFSARFNHFVGVSQVDDLKKFYLHVIIITFPLVVFPLVAVSIMARGIVISWVGVEYSQSVEIVQWLVLCNTLGFISYPAGMLMLAQEKLKQMYIVNMLMPVIFWVGVFSTLSLWGVNSFAIFKFVAFIISGVVYLWFSLKFLNISMLCFLRKVILPYLLPLVIMIGILFSLQDVCVTEKSKLNLLINALIVGVAILIATGLSLYTNKTMQEYAKKTLQIIRKR